MDKLLSERYCEELDGVLSCYDRVVITGNLQPFCYAQGMTRYLYQQGIRIFEYAQFAEPLRERLRENAEALAQANGVKIEFLRSGKKDFRKENRVQQIMKKRGDQPGLVHIFGAMEACSSYRPWHDKTTGKTYLKPDHSKCMTYYFYFIDEQLGLCYLRVPTWCPFRLQFYFNGHNWLANQLKRRGIAYKMLDNAFVQIADYTVANQLADEFDVEILHFRLDAFAQKYCPVVTDLKLTYYWSILQAEYATDLVFKSRDTLQAFYPHLLETLTHAVKPADVATFLGRKLNGNYQGEMGNRFNKRWLGTRIKHQMGPVSVKMYDKFRFILRIEIFFRAPRESLEPAEATPDPYPRERATAHAPAPRRAGARTTRGTPRRADGARRENRDGRAKGRPRGTRKRGRATPRHDAGRHSRPREEAGRRRTESGTGTGGRRESSIWLSVITICKPGVAGYHRLHGWLERSGSCPGSQTRPALHHHQIATASSTLPGRIVRLSWWI